MTTDTIKALRDALTDVLNLPRGTSGRIILERNDEERLRLALTADASERPACCACHGTGAAGFGSRCTRCTGLGWIANASEDAPDAESDDLQPGTLLHSLHEMGNIIREGGRWGGNEFEYAVKEESDVAMLDDMLTHAMQLARSARPAPVAATPAPDGLLIIGATMANVMCNLAQRQGYVLTDADCEMYSDLRKKWDAARRAASPAAPTDPMDWPLPCDVTIGAGTIRKGCALRTLVARMTVMNNMIREGWSSAPAAPIAEVTAPKLTECRHCGFFVALNQAPAPNSGPTAEHAKPEPVARMVPAPPGHIMAPPDEDEVKLAEWVSLAEEYSDMLRKICFEFSAGGYNSEGLMLPSVADAKIRWIIEDVRTASLWQAARAQQSGQQAGAVDGEAS